MAEYVEVTRFGSARREFLRCDRPVDYEAMLRQEYIAGEITVERLEAEMEQVMQGNPPARFGRLTTEGEWR
jgi:hypothetical protein